MDAKRPLQLLKMLANEVDDEMLSEIAAADGYEYEEHLAGLKKIRDELDLSSADGWNPKEALGLARWMEPDDAGARAANAGERGHVKRAFCCAALILSDADAGFCSDNLVQLILSVRRLGGAYLDPTLELVDWVLESPRARREEATLYYAVAKLWLVLEKGAAVPPELLSQLCTSIIDEEERLRRDAVVGRPPKEFFLGVLSGIRNDAWRRICADIESHRQKSSDVEAYETLSRLADRFEAGAASDG